MFRVSAVVAPKNNSSYFDLGNKCKLIVIDINSGKELIKSTHWASGDSLCWLKDSCKVLFSSFDDKLLYDTLRSEVSGSTSYGAGYSDDDRFQRSLYTFDITTGEVAKFAKGDDPYGTYVLFKTDNPKIRQVIVDSGYGKLDWTVAIPKEQKSKNFFALNTPAKTLELDKDLRSYYTWGYKQGWLSVFESVSVEQFKKIFQSRYLNEVLFF